MWGSSRRGRQKKGRLKVRSRIGLIPAKKVSLNGWTERKRGGRKGRKKKGKERDGKRKKEGKKKNKRNRKEGGEERKESWSE